MQAPALKKLLFFEDDDDLGLKRAYHHKTHWDHVMGSSVNMAHPAAAMPKSGLFVSCTCMAACFLACFLSRGRHQEKWWMGGMCIGTGYYAASKCHKVDNGVQGHIAGTWCAGIGLVGHMFRAVANSGTKWFNASCIVIYTALFWYELGRFHVWSAWLTEFKKTLGTGQLQDIWQEYTPRDVEHEFLAFRQVVDVEPAKHLFFKKEGD